MQGRVKVLRVLIGKVLVLFGKFLDDLLAEFVVSIRSWHNVTFLALTCVSDSGVSEQLLFTCIIAVLDKKKSAGKVFRRFGFYATGTISIFFPMAANAVEMN